MGLSLSSERPAIYCAASSTAGYGIFAGRVFQENERIFTLVGNVMTLQEVLAQGELEANAYQIDKETYIYPTQDAGRFINHSCNPNAGLREDREMIALRRIDIGEEICFDYSTCMSEKLWTMSCRCGSPECRGLIGDFHDLPEAIQRRYLQRGVVQRFIVREIFERAMRLVSSREVPSAEWANAAARLVPLTLKSGSGGEEHGAPRLVETLQ